MAKLGRSSACERDMFRDESSSRLQVVETEFLANGTTFNGRPSSFTGVGGSLSRTNSVSNVFTLFINQDCQAYTNPSWPLVMQSSIAKLFLIITGMPTQSESLPGTSFVFAQGGCSHIIF